MNDNNPRATIGGNRPPASAQEIVEGVLSRLAMDHDATVSTAAAVVEKAAGLPDVTDEASLKVVADAVVEMRSFYGDVEALRVAEKDPHFRSAQAVDGFFNSLKEKITKAAEPLKRRVDAYQKQKLAEERERRRREEEAAREAARAAEDEARRLEREAEEAKLAAERARKPETIAAKEEVAEQAAAAASGAAVEATLAADQAHEARIETLRKPADMARSRFETGRIVTMRQVGYVEIVDKSLLDPAVLWPYVSEADALKALRAWAKSNGHKKPMAGAVIELQDDSVIK